ncbi:DUF4381 domain-containing protein [Porticoccaceae bacterium]|nr:DUF4381 domain-containing protein [Porticoccaceae bacterium]
MESDPLAQLRDIHLPETISWWPLAPGWWVLIILLGLVTGWIIVKAVQRKRANLYRRQALAKLLEIEQYLMEHEPSADKEPLANKEPSADRKPSAENLRAPLADIFVVLKQTANIAYPNQQASSLSIEKFIGFLQSSCVTGIFTDMPDNLSSALYSSSDQQTETSTTPALHAKVLASAKTWVIEHKQEAKP